MPNTQKTREVSAKEAVESIRGPMTNTEVMQKFKLNPSGYADLLKQLFEKGLITRHDLERRGIRFTLQRKQAEPLPVQQVIATAAPEEDDEFLDTMALAGLLSFKSPDEPSSPPPAKKPLPPSAAPRAHEEPNPSGKKKKFSIGGFFRKER